MLKILLSLESAQRTTSIDRALQLLVCFSLGEPSRTTHFWIILLSLDSEERIYPSDHSKLLPFLPFEQMLFWNAAPSPLF